MRTSQQNQFIMLAMLLFAGLLKVSALSDKRLCGNTECNKIISLGSARMNYNAAAPGMVSFRIRSPIRIFSKEAGTDSNLWGVEVSGRRGYAPKSHIKEEKVYVKRDALIEVPTTEEVTEKQENTTLKPSELNIEESKPTDPLQDVPPVVENVTKSPDNTITNVTPVQIVDGTSIPFNDNVETTTTISLQQKKENATENVSDKKMEEAEEEKKEEEKKEEEKKEAEKKEAEKLMNELNKESKTIANEVKEEDIVEKDSEEEIEAERTSTTTEPDSILSYLNTFVESDHTTTVTPPTTGIPVKENVIELSNELKNEDKDGVTQEEGEVKKVSSDVLEDVLKKNELNEAVKEQPNKSEGTLSAVVFEEVPKENEIDIETIKKEEKDELSSNVLKAGPTEEALNETVTAAPKKENEKLSTEALETVVNNDIVEEQPKKEEEKLSTGVLEEMLQKNEKNVIVEDAPKKEDEKVPPSVVESILKKDIVQEQLKKREEKLADVVLEELLTVDTVKEEPTKEDKKLSSSVVESILKDDILKDQTKPEVEETIKDEFEDQMLDNILINRTSEAESPVKNIDEKNMVNMNESNDMPEKVMETLAANDINENESKLLATPTDTIIAGKSEDSGVISEQIIAANVNTLNDILPPEVPNPVVPSENKVLEESLTTPSYDTLPVDPNDFYRKLQEQTPKPWEQVVPTILPNHNSAEAKPENQEVPQTIEIENEQEVPQVAAEHSDPVTVPADTPASAEKMEHEGGLFGTILGTVNSFWSTEKKEAALQDDDIQRILYPDSINDISNQYCQKEVACECNEWKDFTMDKFLEKAADKFLELSDLLACLGITSLTCLVFVFGYYCFCNSSREGSLFAKLNQIERSLLVAQKENVILNHELVETREKLSGIEDNSFGSNDMVVALKHELENLSDEKEKLQQQVQTLEKELENATEAGLELNKIVSDLLSNQTGDESIISSVEELQKQLNEQQNTILEINANLADKSRENSELQLMLAEQGARLNGEIASLQQDNDELETEKSNLQTRLEEMKNEFDEDIKKALEGKNYEIKRLQHEIMELQRKCEAEHTRWQTSMAKVEALEECLKTVKKDPSVNISEVINVANVRAEVLDMQKKCASLKERLDVELEAKRLVEDKLNSGLEETEKLKVDFHQSEKDKLEAQTRLEVLSNYFKEKETQLQKELSVKEAMWLKQQGETTSTVDRLTSMQEEINSLKSQNDALRAEIEAQLAAHKALTGTLENRAHETWLAARQSERRYEEARAEASALRRKLTALVGGNLTDGLRVTSDGKVGNDASSPIHLESPGSPLLGRLPPPGFLPPPPFLGPPPPFMGMPPPPFVAAGEMRPAPLGRIMSPPPRGGYSSGKYNNYDAEYDDYDDYDDDENEHRHQRRRRYSRDSDDWPRHRNNYSPPRTYRSQSPTDSRYNYTTDRELISTYDTETDFSPPPSPPRERRTRSSRAGSLYSPPPPTASSPLTENSNGKRPSTSSVNKAFAAINLSRIDPYYNNSSSESNNDRRCKRGGGTGTDSERSSNKTHNGRHAQGMSLV